MIICNGERMKKYLITIDLDGTLLNNSSKISTSSKSYLKKLINDGHKIVIATGRPYRGCRMFYDELGLDTPLIFHNGAGIYHPNDDSFKSFEATMPKASFDELFNYAKDNIVTMFYSINNELYIYNYLPEVKFYYHLNADTKIYEGPLDDPSFPETSNSLVVLNVGFKKEFETYIEKNLKDLDHRHYYDDELYSIYEVYPKGYSKGSAVNIVRDYYNFKNEETISFGDGENDVELLEMSGHGVKMINGSKNLDSVKDAVTTHTNDEDGVIKYLKEYLK